MLSSLGEYELQECRGHCHTCSLLHLLRPRTGFGTTGKVLHRFVKESVSMKRQKQRETAHACDKMPTRSGTAEWWMKASARCAAPTLATARPRAKRLESYFPFPPRTHLQPARPCSLLQGQPLCPQGPLPSGLCQCGTAGRSGGAPNFLPTPAPHFWQGRSLRNPTSYHVEGEKHKPHGNSYSTVPLYTVQKRAELHNLLLIKNQQND